MIWYAKIQVSFLSGMNRSMLKNMKNKDD